MNKRWLFPIAAAAGAFAAYRIVSRRGKKNPGPMTPSTSSVHAADQPIGPAGENLDDRLDEALQESFPTSDPVSIEVR